MLSLVLASVVCTPSYITNQSNCRSSGGGSYVIRPRIVAPGFYVQGKDDDGTRVNLTCIPSPITTEVRCSD